MGRPKLYHTEEERKAAKYRGHLKWKAKPGNKERMYEANQKTQSERHRRWRKTHLEYIRLRSANDRAKKLNRTPPWADLNGIKEFYMNCPKGHHVDHIIPLSGKNVSGLHVLENLQYLPAKENLRKGNKF